MSWALSGITVRSISAALSGKERWLISRTAAGNQAWYYRIFCKSPSALQSIWEHIHSYVHSLNDQIRRFFKNIVNKGLSWKRKIYVFVWTGKIEGFRERQLHTWFQTVNDRISWGSYKVWVFGWNPMVWPFKWNLFSSTSTRYHLLCLYVVLTLEYVDEILWCEHSKEASSAVLSNGTICFEAFYKATSEILFNLDFG